jgi:predicted thioesterase
LVRRGAPVVPFALVPVTFGACGEASLTVAEGDLAPAFRSGVVAVLATPRLVALCEEAACNALEDRLGEGQTSVGWRCQVDHVAPVALGGEVKATATLERIEGRRLTFQVSVADHCGIVAAGRMSRVVVDVDRFLDRAR